MHSFHLFFFWIECWWWWLKYIWNIHQILCCCDNSDDEEWEILQFFCISLFIDSINLNQMRERKKGENFVFSLSSDERTNKQTKSLWTIVCHCYKLKLNFFIFIIVDILPECQNHNHHHYYYWEWWWLWNFYLKFYIEFWKKKKKTRKLSEFSNECFCCCFSLKNISIHFISIHTFIECFLLLWIQIEKFDFHSFIHSVSIFFNSFRLKVCLCKREGKARFFSYGIFGSFFLLLVKAKNYIFHFQ